MCRWSQCVRCTSVPDVSTRHPFQCVAPLNVLLAPTCRWLQQVGGPYVVAATRAVGSTVSPAPRHCQPQSTARLNALSVPV
eukprot:6179247-Pleurochrysis_carterae.AAC.1